MESENYDNDYYGVSENLNNIEGFINYNQPSPILSTYNQDMNDNADTDATTTKTTTTTTTTTTATTTATRKRKFKRCKIDNKIVCFNLFRDMK